MPANRQSNPSFFSLSWLKTPSGAAPDGDSPYTDANGVVVAGSSDPGPGVRKPSNDSDKKPSGTAPAKASSAPGGNNKYTFVGLCAAMNQYEQQLVKDKVVEYANQYSVELVGEIKSAKLVLPGTVDKSKTAAQNTNDPKSKIDSDTNSVNTKSLQRAAVAGTQMIQFIEQVIRNSSYITNQQKGIVDQQTGNAKPSNSSTSNKTTKWFKISVNAVPISPKIDKKRNDYAYKITYIVSPYGINQAESQYFPQATYRGTHKVYDYWFTGDNTQVLQYEQNYHALYFDVMDGKLPVNETGAAKSFSGIETQWQNTRVPTTASAESDKGANKGANNPASTLADYLYSVADQGKVTLRIVGDPAWIQQGEILGLDSLSFNFSGFYPDGSINTDAQQPVFVLNWNAPADYNLGTGLMDVNASATQGNNNNLQKAQPAQTAAYQGVTVKSYFNHGKFEQELAGTLIKNLNQVQLNNTDATRGSTPSFSKLFTGGLSSVRDALADASRPVAGGNGEWDTGRSGDNEAQEASDSSESIDNESTSTSAAAEEPTSNGDIAPGDYEAPQDASYSSYGEQNELSDPSSDGGQTMAPRDD